MRHTTVKTSFTFDYPNVSQTHLTMEPFKFVCGCTCVCALVCKTLLIFHRTRLSQNSFSETLFSIYVTEFLFLQWYYS